MKWGHTEVQENKVDCEIALAVTPAESIGAVFLATLLQALEDVSMHKDGMSAVLFTRRLFPKHNNTPTTTTTTTMQEETTR